KFRQKDYAGGAEDNQAALRARPDHEDALYNLGLCRLNLGKNQEAEADFSRFLERQPKDWGAYLKRGVARLGTGANRGALADLSRSLELKPDNPETLLHRGRAKHNLGQWSEAVADYDKVIALDPLFMNAHFNRGLSRARLADHMGAIEDFTRYLEKYPEDSEAYVLRANRRLDRGDYRWAAEDYEKAVSLSPKSESELRPWIERALKLRKLELEGPPSEFALACSERGWGKQDGGEAANALLWFEKALKIDADCSSAWHGSGCAFYAMDRNEEALKNLRKALLLSPKNPDIHCDLARALRVAKDASGAMEHLKKALEVKPDLARAYWWQGLIHLDRQEYQNAVRDFSKYLELDPDKNSAAWNYRGRARHKLGKIADAVADFTRAIEIAPGEAEYVANRGYAKLDLKDREGAAADFKTASSLNPDLKASLERALGGGASSGGVAGKVPAKPAAPKVVGTSTPLNGGEVRSLVFGWAGFAFVMLLLGIPKIPILGDWPRRTLDVGYKAWWIVEHWNNPLVFPHKANLCMEPFCTRIDTTKKYVGGHRGYTSQVDYNYCPEHQPTFFSMGIRFDGFLYFIYWAVAIFLSAFLYGVPFALALRILMWPVLLPLWKAGKISSGLLLPRLPESGSPAEKKLNTFSFWVTGAFVLSLWTMFAFW
ncbi:MAG TPA: tetratricopeptide repeat protein, partial [Planctomycetota bacterium]|nr:tetratricopeptide repeat protein [Planctomycetota bacterium]